jgi:hypothetical protein
MSAIASSETGFLNTIFVTQPKGCRNPVSLVANKLNCRINAGSNYPVLVTWQKNVRLTVETPDESQAIKKDASGKPWLRVKFKDNACFVRANSKYINPL